MNNQYIAVTDDLLTITALMQACVLLKIDFKYIASASGLIVTAPSDSMRLIQLLGMSYTVKFNLYVE